MPEELWMEVCDIVQEAVIKTIPKEKKCRKAKRLSEEASVISAKKYRKTIEWERLEISSRKLEINKPANTTQTLVFINTSVHPRWR